MRTNGDVSTTHRVVTLLVYLPGTIIITAGAGKSLNSAGIPIPRELVLVVLRALF